MALTKTTYTERVLIVLNEDGTFKAAHKETQDVVRDGETVISRTLAPAAPLAEADLAGVLPDAAALTAQLVAKDAELVAMTAERDEWKAKVPPNAADPGIVTMRQARLALHNAGILPSVETYMASAPAAVQIEWEYADIVRRNADLVSSIGGALGLSSQQIDDLFAAAKTL